MKALAGLICATALFAVTANADAKTMYAGAKGGVNMASLSGDGVDDMDSRNGFIGGAFYGVDFGQFGVRLEGLYVQKGAEGSFVVPGDDHAHESIVKLDYVEFPLLFTGTFPAGEKFAFNVFAGPTFGFNTGAEVEIPGHGETVDISDSVESFEFGAAIGGGIEYMLSSFSIILDARYSLGASNIVAEGDEDVKNRGIGVMAGVKFPLGAK
jgi:hypothetical protein